MDMRQVFSFQFSINHVVRVTHLRFRIDPESLGALTPQLEFQPPDVNVWVVVRTIPLLEELGVPLEMRLLRLDGFVVDAGTRRSCQSHSP